jgi:hypothetical protein
MAMKAAMSARPLGVSMIQKRGLAGLTVQIIVFCVTLEDNDVSLGFRDRESVCPPDRLDTRVFLFV